MIEAHIINWNEEETIHLTIKHYQAFCEKIIIWDNFSDDRSPEIARSMGCTVKTFGKQGELSDRSYMELKNECWKKNNPGQDTRSWVIVCDADEILLPLQYSYVHKTKTLSYFEIAKGSGVSMLKTQGWNVFSYDVPSKTWLEATYGIPDENYSKTVIFDPKQITDIGFHIGAHVSRPKGNVIWSEEKLFLLHYRNVGGPERLVKRHALYRERLSPENKQRGFGIHYTWNDEQRIKEWHEKYSASKPLEHFLQAGISQS